jgi:hypothetical protein
MKNIVLGFVIAATSLIACSSNTAADTKQTEVKNNAQYPVQPKMHLIQPLQQHQ